jgi:quercetin 2,3-dioxygenase
MLDVRYAEDRGAAKIDWLDSKHTFSFGHYHDPDFMGFGPLRVINEDRVKPAAGFPTHGHRDMEIISYVLDGALEHKDSIGTGSVIRPGDVQIMSAGTGIRHSEFNHSAEKPVHFLQIWVIPDKDGIKPRYDQKAFTDAEKRGRLRLVGSKDGRDGSLVIHQDVDLYATLLNTGEEVAHSFKPGRNGWVQVARGKVTVNGEQVQAGDGIALKAESKVTIAAVADGAEVLVFDLP